MASGRFQILDILGAGAFAVVCTATDRPTGRLVALKVLRASVRDDPGAVARLRDEGRILQRLRHPCIVGGLEIVDYGSHPVLAIDRIDGVSLEALLQHHVAFAPPEALWIGARVASALAFAWEAPAADGQPMRIVHRDLKPNNVLVDRSGQVRIVDFGIAKGQFHGRKARSLFVVQGTAGFDAPERREGAADGPEVDVYGLGALLMTLLTGKAPLISRRDEVRGAELDQYLDRVPEHPAIAVDEVRALIRRMLSATGSERPTMPELARELEALAVGADLPRLAARELPPLLDHTLAPREHPCWDELAFLETEAPTEASALSRSEVERWVRSFVESPDWERRAVELETVLGRSDEVFAPSALVAVLGRATVPWYTPWVQPARATELEAALLALCDRLDPTVVARARPLCEHPDPRVMAAARFLVSQSG